MQLVRYAFLTQIVRRALKPKCDRPASCSNWPTRTVRPVRNCSTANTWAAVGSRAVRHWRKSTQTTRKPYRPKWRSKCAKTRAGMGSSCATTHRKTSGRWSSIRWLPPGLWYCGRPTGRPAYPQRYGSLRNESDSLLHRQTSHRPMSNETRPKCFKVLFVSNNLHDTYICSSLYKR